MSTRIDNIFSALHVRGQSSFVAYIMGGDPNYARSLELMKALPGAGVDIIELGFPFTDPAADGPVIEAAGLRALKSGATVTSVLNMASEFRKGNSTTPIILMGYANPVHHMGYAAFAKAAYVAGVDGAIIVDLPPEEDAPLRKAFEAHNLALIRLATPTTDEARLPKVVSGTKGFVYYVSVSGITGAGLGASQAVEQAVARVRQASGLPVVVGFGVKTPEQAEEIARHADGVVVGSAIVDAFHKGSKDTTLKLIKALSNATHGQN